MRALCSASERRAATPKGNLWREAASDFQKRAQTSAAPSSANSQTKVRAPVSTQQTRNQFRATLHTAFDKDIAQMKLDRLFADLKSRSDLGVGQTLDTAKRDLRFAPAQTPQIDDPPDRGRQRGTAVFNFHAFRVNG